MYKVILLVRRKPGLTMEAFIDAYENRMVPIIERHFGKYMLDYRRDYVIKDDPLGFNPAEAALGTVTKLPFRQQGGPGATGESDDDLGGLDVITELLFKDRATMDQMFAEVSQPEISAEIATEGHSFIDMQSAHRYITEVYAARES